MRRFKQRLLRMPLLLIPAYFIVRILHGLAVYRRMCRDYGETADWYSAFSTSGGDVYFAASAYRAAVDRDGTGSSARFLTMGEGERQIALWFGLEGTVAISERSSNNLLRMYRFLKADHSLRLHIMHCQPAQMYVDLCEHLLSFRQFDFLTMLRLCYGGVLSRELAAPLVPEDVGETVEQFFCEKGLRPNRTVVLAPYAYCMEMLPAEQWGRLAASLESRGFSVCTNCSGGERPIPGTVAVSIPYRYMPGFLERAGYLIALRSGLVDATHTASCKRIILYPKKNFNMWGVGTPMDCFSLKKMGLRDDAVELEYGYGGADELYSLIWRAVETWT